MGLRSTSQSCSLRGVCSPTPDSCQAVVPARYAVSRSTLLPSNHLLSSWSFMLPPILRAVHEPLHALPGFESNRHHIDCTHCAMVMPVESTSSWPEVGRPTRYDRPWPPEAVILPSVSCLICRPASW